MFLARNGASIADYTSLIRVAPSPEAYVERAHVYVADRKFDLAINDAGQAIGLNPKSWSAFNERGVSYYRKGEFQSAIEDFDNAIALWPTPEIYANRAQANEALRKSSAAIADYRQALSQNPSLVMARQALKRLGAEDAALVRETDSRVREGATLAESKCQTCHAIGTTGASPDKNAPPFRDIKGRRPTVWLTAPIAQGVMATHQRMPRFDLSTDDINKVIAYINSRSEEHTSELQSH